MRQRARTLKVLRNMRAREKGANIEKAVSEVLAERAAVRLKGKTYLTAKDTDARRSVVKAFIPTRADQLVAVARRVTTRTFAPKKRRLAEKMFGEKGQFVMTVVHPELLASAQQIKHAIKQAGAQVILSKILMVDRATFLELYPQSFDYAKRHENFPMFAENVQSAPNQMIIIKLKETHQTHDEKNAALSILKRSLREKFAQVFIERHGLRGKLDQTGRNFDPSGFLQAEQRRLEKIQAQYSGFHIPDAQIMARNAEMLLTKKELERISKQI